MLETIFSVIVILYSVILHELAHGLMARSLGDDTAKYAGRLTLNPLPHLDLFGSILLPLLTWQFGGFIFGYAKPVPYNPLNLRDQKYGPAKVAAAGPLSNLILAVLFGLLLRFLPSELLSPELARSISFIVLLNIGLAVFNLMPIPPLDGHWLLLTFLPDRWNQLKQAFVRFGLPLFVIFLLFFSRLLSPLISFLFSVIVGTRAYI